MDSQISDKGLDQLTETRGDGEHPVRLLDDPALYLNRELSLLAFQSRVLEEAEDTAVPLLERVKFLSILSSNMDEFFMVRVAALRQQAAAGVTDVSIDGRTATEQLTAIRADVLALMDRAHTCYRQQILPALDAAGIHLLDYSSLTSDERAALERHFLETIFPVLTPLAFDPGRPFPHISSLSLNLAVVVKDSRGVTHFARVKVPDTLPPLVPVGLGEAGAPGGLPAAARPDGPRSAPGDPAHRFVWLEQVIQANLQALFPGLDIVEAHPFRITRDAEVDIQELESNDLLETIEEAVWRRRFRGAVRLQVDRALPPDLLAILMEEPRGAGGRRVSGRWPARAEGASGSCRPIDRPRLKYRVFSPSTPAALKSTAGDDLFALIRREDLLLHHPYDSFEPVVEFLRAAARDPEVLAIKMTLYRVGRNSPDRRGAPRCHRRRQAGRGAGGAQGAVRRGEQHRVGPRAGTRRRARRVRTGGPQDALQAGPGGAARRRGDARVRPPGDGQLQSGHRAPVHRPGPLHRRRVDRQRCGRPCSTGSPATPRRTHYRQAAGGAPQPRDRGSKSSSVARSDLPGAAAGAPRR